MALTWNPWYDFESSVLAADYQSDSEVVADTAVASWCAECPVQLGVRWIKDYHRGVLTYRLSTARLGQLYPVLATDYRSLVPNKPAYLKTPLPSPIGKLMTYGESDIVNALPIEDEHVWCGLRSYRTITRLWVVSEDQTWIT